MNLYTKKYREGVQLVDGANVKNKEKSKFTAKTEKKNV